MRTSDRRTADWNREFARISQKRHIDRVWKAMGPVLGDYIDKYLDSIEGRHEYAEPEIEHLIFANDLVRKSDAERDAYLELFGPEIMDEYALDTEGFKNVHLRREFDIIRSTFQSRKQSLSDWKMKFTLCKSQVLYDAFDSMLSFAAEYDEYMDEKRMEALDDPRDCRLSEMFGLGCYVNGVISYGIVSNVLGTLYPRTIPAQHKAGLWSLYFIARDCDWFDLPSRTSEFYMIKDQRRGRTGVIEADHNYNYPYEVFCVYTLRIWRELAKRIEGRCGRAFPADHRFALTTDFYDFVSGLNSERIANLSGEDEKLRFVL